MALNVPFLRVFSAVAEARSFSRAAEQLFMSQPAVSKAVRELEQQVGLALLDRSARPIALTEAGAVLLAHAHQMFADERAAERALDQLREVGAGSLAVGASSTIGIYLLPSAIARFHRAHPRIRLFLDIGNTQQVLEHLRGATLDVAFVEGPVEGEDLLIEPWRLDELVVVAPHAHPLAHGEPVTLERLLAEPFVLREPGSGTREVIELALRARGATLTVPLELGSTEAIKRAVIAGMGLAIVSVATVTTELATGQLRLVPVPELPLRRTLTRLSIVGRPPSPAVRAFLAILEVGV